MTEGTSIGGTVRSFLSRASKSQSHLGDFYIELEDPHRKYHPGDHVRGAVKINATKSSRITHLVIQLHGAVRVYKANRPLSKEPAKVGSVKDAANTKGTPGFHLICDIEKVLLGDGMLHESNYSIQFSIRLPTNGVPSSLKFERGYICYNLEAVLTKPKKVNPTTTTSRRIQVTETIDIAWMPVPEPQRLLLPQVRRRAISRGSLRPTTATLKPEAIKTVEQTLKAEPVSNEGSSNTTATRSRSARSSFEQHEPTPGSTPLENSAILNAGEHSEAATATSASGSPTVEKPAIVLHPVNGIATVKPVHATVELPRIGYLPGDIITVTMNIKHKKPIWSMHGVIITFARYGYTSLYPDMHESSDEEDDDDVDGVDVNNDVSSSHSRSSRQRFASGFSRLRRSRGDKSASFQKNLSQTFAPLIVDRRTLAAVVKASVKIPPDCFPTIAHGTGDLVAIRYFVEVIVDLGGKLASQSKYLPSLSVVSNPGSTGPEGRGNGLPEDMTQTTISTSGSNIIETHLLKREKNVVSCRFEVIIGTKDSSRNGKATHIPSTPLPIGSASSISARTGEHAMPILPPAMGPLELPHRFASPRYTEVAESSRAAANRHLLLPEEATPRNLDEALAQQSNEKARLQLAEQILLPSAPPDEVEEDGGFVAALGPSVPPPLAPPRILTDLNHIEDKMGIERERSDALPDPPAHEPREPAREEPGSEADAAAAQDDGDHVAEPAFADAVPSRRIDSLPRYER